MKIDIRPIRNERDYNWALAEIEKYFDREPASGTPAAARFDILAALIEGYESKHWPIEAPDAVSAIKFRMQQRGWTQQDLAKLLGSKSRASEILARKRGLTLAQAYKLNRDWQIPAEALLQQDLAD
jgi:HTH-type transcriptional regulator/antitoxin HigA